MVYIAPLKALVRERIDDWGQGLCRVLNKRMVELTGEVTPDIKVRPPPPRMLSHRLSCPLSTMSTRGDARLDWHSQALLAADLIVCTPEKWDGISRSWQSRGYVKKVRRCSRTLNPCRFRMTSPPLSL